MEKTIVNQVKAHDVEVDRISIGSIADGALTDRELLELADVVKAIETASSHEIKTINHGFESLKASLLSSFSRAKKTEEKRQAPQKQRKNVEKSAQLPDRTNGSGVAPANIIDKRPKSSVKMDESGRELPKSKSDKSSRQITLTEADELPVTELRATVDSTSSTQNNVPHSPVKTSEKSPLINRDTLAGYRMDESGRLRNEKGAFASKVEQKQYEKAQALTDDDKGGDSTSEDGKQTSLLKQAVFSLGRLALIGADKGIGRNGLADKDSSLKTTAGVAVGGSYFLAAQEVATFLTEAKESLKDSGIESFGDVFKKAKESATGAIDNVASAGGKVAAVAKSVQVKILGNDNPSIKDDPKLKKSSPSWLKSGANPLFRFFSKLKPKASKTDLDALSVQKKEAQAAEQRHQENVIALGDVEDAIKGIKTGGGDSGIFGEALDFLGDRKKRKRARGASKVSRASRSGRFDIPERTQRSGGAARGSAYGNTGRAIPSVAGSAGTAVKGSMGGAALRAGGAVLSKLALPLTVAMAAYDGFSGYNDTEGQKEAFKLQEGQEASFGQKAAMATGSVLSLGGLTDMIGFSGSDISKGIYKAFGGQIEGEESPSITLATPIALLTDAASSLTSFADPAKLKETFGKDSEDEIGIGEKSAAAAGAILSLGGLTDKLFGVGGDDISKSIYSFFKSDSENTDTGSNGSPKQEPKQNPKQNPKQIPQTDLGGSDKSNLTTSVATVAAAQPVPSTDVTSTSASKYVEDIEQIESVNKINEKTAANKDKKTTGEVKTSVINSSDPEIVKLLKSIDRKLDDKSKPAPFATRFGGGSQSSPSRSAGGVPSDFSNDSQRQQANNLG